MDLRMRTRLMKIILSSGTPCSIRTSTAFIAEPPVAVHRGRCTSYERDDRKLRCKLYVPSMGSRRRT